MAQWIDMEVIEKENHASLLWFFYSLGAIRQITSLESASSRDMRSVRDFSASMSTHLAIRWVISPGFTFSQTLKIAQNNVLVTFDSKFRIFRWKFQNYNTHLQ